MLKLNVLPEPRLGYVPMLIVRTSCPTIAKTRVELNPALRDSLFVAMYKLFTNFLLFVFKHFLSSQKKSAEELRSSKILNQASREVDGFGELLFRFLHFISVHG
jgi:hypothetical protein